MRRLILKSTLEKTYAIQPTHFQQLLNKTIYTTSINMKTRLSNLDVDW